MKKNMGSIDKAFRITLAVVLFLLYINNVVSDTLGIVLVVAGVVFVLTSLISFCPLYTFFGFSTCKVK